MSKDFQPSIAGAQVAALGTPIVHKKYPPGVEGIEISLEDVVARVRKGRLDPRVRSWAIRTLKEAGDPQGTVQKAQALLDGLRKAAIYVQDPLNAEYIQAAHETLCLDDKGFCFRGGDCFPKGTKVFSNRNEGKIAIEDVRVGEVIWGWRSWTRVEAVADKGDLAVSRVHLKLPPSSRYADPSDRVLRLTREHHVFRMTASDESHERVRVEDLRPGDRLLRPHRVTEVDPAEVIRVELDVETAHCFDIQTEDHYVLLPECDVTVSQCDDLTTALGSATASVGIPTYVVGQAFNGDSMASHVLVGVEDPQTHVQYHVDPSSKTFSVGGHHFATKEWWIDPTKEVKVTLSGTEKKISSGETLDADFVGVGAGPMTITGAAYDAVVTQIQAAWQSIADANVNLQTSLDQLDRARALFRPNIPFDPELAAPVQSLGDFPSDAGTWTESMDTYARDLLATGQSFQKAFEDALSGARAIYADATGDAGIAAASSDSHLYQVVMRGATDSIIGIFVPGGPLVAGVLSKLGSLLTPQQVQDAQSGKTGVGAVPVVAVVAGVAVVTVAICYTWVKLEEIAAAKAQTVLQQDTIKFAAQMVESGQWTADKAAAFIKQKDDFVLAAKRADAEYQKNDPFAGTFRSLGDIVMWTVIGGVAVGAIMLGAPLVRELGARYRASGEAKSLQPAGA